MKPHPLKLLITLTFLLSFIQSNAEDSLKYKVYFETNSSDLDTIEIERIIFFMRNFKNYDVSKIDIKAYCDERGGKKFNDDLSRNRARNIAIAFKASTDKPIYVEYQGLGYIDLRDNIEVDKQRAKNRRADVIVYYSTKTKKSTKEKRMPMPKTSISKEVKEMESFINTAEAGQKLKLKIFFMGGSHQLIRNSYQVLDSLVKVLSDNKRRVRIEGHIFFDGRSPKEEDGYDFETKTYNLSENRAKVVYQHLLKNGIAKERLEFAGMAGKFPTGEASTDRRVEIVLLD